MKRTLALGLCLGVSMLGSAIFADSYEPAPEDPPPVNVYETTMEKYVNKADCNMLMKVYSSAYVAALSEEASALAKKAEKRFPGSQDIPNDIKKAHRAAENFAIEMGNLSESISWYDFESNEPFWGTGYGYQIMSFQADIYWREIVFFQTILQSNDSMEFHGFDCPKLNDKIGGMSPSEIMSAVRVMKDLRASKTKRSATLDKRASSTMDKDFVRTFKQVKKAILSNDAEAVAKFVSFPVADSAWIARPDLYDGDLDREGFIKGFKVLFTDFALREIAKKSLKDVHEHEGSYSFWFKMGEDEVDPDGGYFEASAGGLKLEKVNGKWMIVGLLMAG